MPADEATTVPYPTRTMTLPAFDLLGYTLIVQSGGEQYEAVWGDGRWEELRELAGPEGSIYGVASLDKECPQGSYRYTVAVLAEAAAGREDLFPLHIRESEWLVFLLHDFGDQYGGFWQADPYALIQRLGWEFNKRVGLHIDLYGPEYRSDHDSMEFLMPVRKPV